MGTRSLQNNNKIQIIYWYQYKLRADAVRTTCKQDNVLCPIFQV